MSGFLERWADSEEVLRTARPPSPAPEVIKIHVPFAADSKETRQTDRETDLRDELGSDITDRKRGHIVSAPADLGFHNDHRKDQHSIEALREVADLLAMAWRRYADIRRIPVDQPEQAVNKELAFPGPQSVHGHG
jgi:hypothetical protein